MPIRHSGGAALAVLALLPAVPAVAQESCAVPPAAAPIPADTGSLTIPAILDAVRAASPDIRAAALETVAQRHEAAQAGLWENPVLSVEAENFGADALGSAGPLRGYDAAETTVSIGQTFRIGGQRRLDRRAAAARAAVAAADRDLVLRTVEREAVSLAYELAAAREAASLFEEAAGLAEDLEGAVRARVEAGESPRAALDRAVAARADAEAAAEEALGTAEALAFALATLWGRTAPVEVDLPSFWNEAQLPPIERLTARLTDHPQRRIADATAEARAAEHRAARAEAYPDVTASVGVRRFEADGTEALVAGLSVPLPLFDRNQGNRRAGRARAAGSAYEAEIAARRLVARAGQAVALAERAERRRRTLVEEALPAAEAAAEAARIGYREGKFDLTTALDAQTRLVETRRAALTAALAARQGQADVLSLASLPPFSPTYCQEANR
ncbi:TolC family protein [Parvularcula dongshanensis]|uniref:Cobalt-zinc-cadmium efflux system outer membrane protein n=1 Tax=Parvularcula dongshanensis TaxID=1173995 RepID=A0A840I4A7_9PROT|nr:TolC family protein [Parvularcula dongshanensis]MBB4659111.1 cobalt-zinc-cadmium efflux system outer membrane protein [Parvularcula dongshanensis]